ncbi:packaged DNA stabilization protein gp10 [bacterium]|jgi:hypothetical protein|nr:packaged DNA stabilization protein gp10 [bacterium]
MVQIPIISGIYASSAPDLRTSYPVNLVPVPKESGISSGYLRPGDGLISFGTGPGIDRGAINWNGVCYRVMGSSLVSVAADGTATTLADVGDDGGPVTFDYSFDRLGIGSAGDLFYWDGLTLSQVTDPDLGTVVDMIWIDGYFMTTDGEFLVVTDLNDPTAINPLKYGSSEADPDPVKALLKLRNEAVALNRHTIEYFDNIGGSLFPFQRIEGAQIEKGCIGTRACCVYMEAVAFLGGGFNEEPSIYLGANAQAVPIATHEINLVLRTYTEAQLAAAELEARNDGAHQFLYVHLPDRTLVYDGAASQVVGEPVWFTLTSSLDGFEQYRARHFVWCYDKWIFGDTQTAATGTISKTVSSHWGVQVRWEFGTVIVYNEGRGVIFNDLELIGLTGSAAFGDTPVLSTSYSLDGEVWSEDRVITAGVTGERAKRLMWFMQGFMRNWRIQRFRGTSDVHMGFIRLEARLEPMAF